jgi:uncharacterized protein YggT (Ycf19 family)
MLVLVRLMNVVFAAYGLGLLVYAFLSSARGPGGSDAVRGLGRLYEPPLRVTRTFIRPVRIGRLSLDLSPLALVGAVAVVWGVIRYILIGAA